MFIFFLEIIFRKISDLLTEKLKHPILIEIGQTNLKTHMCIDTLEPLEFQFFSRFCRFFIIHLTQKKRKYSIEGISFIRNRIMAKDFKKLIEYKRTIFLSYFFEISWSKCLALEVICSSPRLEYTILLRELIPSIVEIFDVAHEAIVWLYFDNFIFILDLLPIEAWSIENEKISIAILLEIGEELSSFFLYIFPLFIELSSPSLTLYHHICLTFLRY